MEVLSTESLERIRMSCMENPNLVECTFEEIEDELNLSLVKFNAPIDSVLIYIFHREQLRKKIKTLKIANCLPRLFPVSLHQWRRMRGFG